MQDARKINYFGHHYQVDTVLKMLADEISLFEKRLVILKRAPLHGQASLVSTYEEMISVRKTIQQQLFELKDR